MALEFKSKNQIRTLFKPLLDRGKLSKENLDIIMSFIDLPDGVNPRKGGVRSSLGGFKSTTFKSSVRKGGFR
jgi:hypothetical protein